ncbi:hypothetical protein [Streptomyces sp. 3N207]|uniref:hypothetical protein n=1 Tax=Streptomyces sp. 3N207 TaxID=3457417 RepID=UPI003FD15849
MPNSPCLQPFHWSELTLGGQRDAGVDFLQAPVGDIEQQAIQRATDQLTVGGAGGRA